MSAISIIGGQVIEPASGLNTMTNLYLDQGKLLRIGEPPPGFTAEWEIDAHGQIVCPGLVDLSVRLREPGAEHKGTIISETRAAANNGITTICCPPDTNPVIDTPAVAELLQHRAAASGMAKVLPIAALTQGLKGEHLAEMGDLKEAGCIAVSNVFPIVNTEVLRHAMEYAANCHLTIFLHAQEPWLGRHGCMHEGAISTRLGLTGIPETAETIEVARTLLLIEMTGVRAHFCRLSSARSVEMVREAQIKGLPITADVSAHHLFLTEMDIDNYNTQCHVSPPFRSQQDRQALREGLIQGGIDAISSDHQPHETDAKLMPFAMSSAGISAIDTLLPLSLRFATEMQLDLCTVLGYLTHKPAQILGIDAGTLTVGQPADICIFDPNFTWHLSPENMHSVAHNSPFLNWEFKGKVTYTIINGKVVYTQMVNEGVQSDVL